MQWKKEAIVATAIVFLVSGPGIAAQEGGKGEAKASERAARASSRQ